MYSNQNNKDREYFFISCFVIFDHLLDTFFAIMLVYLLIRFTKPYSPDEHASFMLVISQNQHEIDTAITYAERMAAAERLLQACRDDANRTMIHLLSLDQDRSSFHFRDNTHYQKSDSLYDQVLKFKHDYQDDTFNETETEQTQTLQPVSRSALMR